MLRSMTTSRSYAGRTGKLVAKALFSTEADAAHKPVLQLHGLHARYANATYVAASKAGVLETVEEELKALSATAKSNSGFASFLENPLIPRAEKVAQVSDLTGGQFSPITTNLLTTMAGNARLNELTKVASTYEQLMKAKRGQVEAVLISAEKLSKKQTDDIANAVLASLGGEGKKVVLQSKVDPSIVGGLQVQIGDKFLDLSVKSRVEEIGRTPI